MRRNKKFNKELLNEELQKFKLMSEYSFYEDRAGDEVDKDKMLYGSLTEEEPTEEEDIELPFGSEDATEDNEETSDEENLDDKNEEEPTEEEGGFGDEEDAFSQEEVAEDDSIELDVTELVKGSEEAKASADAANAKIDQLMQMVGKLEGQLSTMDAISNKIENLESEFEKRNPTEEEKLEMRSLSSAPYNLKLTDFWKDKSGIYNVMGDEEESEPKEYVLTKDDIESDYNELDAKKSIGENPFEEDEI